MNQEFAHVLGFLQGLPVTRAGRAVTMLTMRFGEQREVMYQGTQKVTADYALHIECPWRIIEHDMMVVGFSDRLYAGNERDDHPDFEWMDSSDTRWDRRMQQFLERTDPSVLIVKAIRVGAVGAFTLEFDRGIRLEVFPDGTADREHWRLFKPYVTSPDNAVIPGPHYVARVKDGTAYLED